MAGVDEARLHLERESVVLSPAEASLARIIEATKGLFSRGYGDVELIGKVADKQVCYINLLDAGSASSYNELSEETRLGLENATYVVKDGIVGDSLMVQATTPEAQQRLGDWKRDESDYFTLEAEARMSPVEQIEALIEAAAAVAASSGELEKLDFILRPTVLHDNLLRAIMEARGVELRRVEPSKNGQGKA
ncbi:MAG: hypothetical protein ACYC56_12415 [Candidatus Aquicultor sp.]